MAGRSCGPRGAVHVRDHYAPHHDPPAEVAPPWFPPPPCGSARRSSGAEPLERRARHGPRRPAMLTPMPFKSVPGLDIPVSEVMHHGLIALPATATLADVAATMSGQRGARRPDHGYGRQPTRLGHEPRHPPQPRTRLDRCRQRLLARCPPSRRGAASGEDHAPAAANPRPGDVHRPDGEPSPRTYRGGMTLLEPPGVVSPALIDEPVSPRQRHSPAAAADAVAGGRAPRAHVARSRTRRTQWRTLPSTPLNSAIDQTRLASTGMGRARSRPRSDRRA